jgi:hypothetical protein
VKSPSRLEPVWQTDIRAHRFQWLRRRTDCIFAWLTEDNHDPKAAHDISTVLWSAGFILTQGVALMAAVRDSHPVAVIQSGDYKLHPISISELSDSLSRDWYSEFVKPLSSFLIANVAIAIYLIASVFPLVVMGTMLKARVYSSDGPKHFFDRPTVASCRWMLTLSILFVFLVTSLCYAKALPNQTILITGSEFHSYTFKDKKEGIAILVFFQIDKMPPKGNMISLSAWLDDTLFPDWRLANVQAFPGAVREKDPLSTAFDGELAKTDRVSSFTIHDVAVGGRYVLKILLKTKDKRTPNQERAIAYLRREDKAIRISVDDPTTEGAEQPH